MFIEVLKFHETSPALKNFWLRTCQPIYAYKRYADQRKSVQVYISVHFLPIRFWKLVFLLSLFSVLRAL